MVHLLLIFKTFVYITINRCPKSYLFHKYYVFSIILSFTELNVKLQKFESKCANLGEELHASKEKTLGTFKIPLKY